MWAITSILLNIGLIVFVTAYLTLLTVQCVMGVFSFIANGLRAARWFYLRMRMKVHPHNMPTEDTSNQ